MAGASSTLSTSAVAVAVATTCSSPVAISGVFSLGWLSQSPLRSDVCPYTNYTNGGGYNNTGGPKQTLPPAGPGQAVYNIPMAFSVADPSSFDGMAAEAALAATLGINASDVVITGGSKGIGKGIARVFSRAGAKVAIFSRHGEEAALAASDIGHGAFGLAADVTSPEAL